MKKTAIFMIFALATASFFTSCAKKGEPRKIFEDGSTPVERYGALQVIGTQLCDKDGNPVQLCGMSSHGLQWYGKYANKDVLSWLQKDFNADLWRAALYSTSYVSDKSLYFKVRDSIEAAIDLGMYVIVDWHVIDEHDPLLYSNQAAAFFEQVASTYGDYPNIIYEICNEPNTDRVTWEKNIKPYAEKIIPVIRKYCNNVIVVGTPKWSSDLLPAAEDPLVGENLMYTFHFYAGTHGKDSRKQIDKALKKGLPIFVTEWGTTQASGDGGVFEKSTLEWTDFLSSRKISWANWSVNNKGEDSGVLKYNKDKSGQGGWALDDLQPSGLLVRKILRGETQDK